MGVSDGKIHRSAAWRRRCAGQRKRTCFRAGIPSLALRAFIDSRNPVAWLRALFRTGEPLSGHAAFRSLLRRASFGSLTTQADPVACSRSARHSRGRASHRPSLSAPCRHSRIAAASDREVASTRNTPPAAGQFGSHRGLSRLLPPSLRIHVCSIGINLEPQWRCLVDAVPPSVMRRHDQLHGAISVGQVQGTKCRETGIWVTMVLPFHRRGASGHHRREVHESTC